MVVASTLRQPAKAGLAYAAAKLAAALFESRPTPTRHAKRRRLRGSQHDCPGSSRPDWTVDCQDDHASPPPPALLAQTSLPPRRLVALLGPERFPHLPPSLLGPQAPALQLARNQTFRAANLRRDFVKDQVVLLLPFALPCAEDPEALLVQLHPEVAGQVHCALSVLGVHNHVPSPATVKRHRHGGGEHPRAQAAEARHERLLQSHLRDHAHHAEAIHPAAVLEQTTLLLRVDRTRHAGRACCRGPLGPPNGARAELLSSQKCLRACNR